MSANIKKQELTKSQLIENIINNLPHWSESDVKLGVNKIFYYIEKALIDKKRIEIRGFGSFSLRYRPSHAAHNPKTGEKVITKPTYVPHFKPGKELRDKVNKGKKTED